jgi:hypothetical protein
MSIRQNPNKSISTPLPYGCKHHFAFSFNQNAKDDAEAISSFLSPRQWKTVRNMVKQKRNYVLFPLA